MKYNELPKWAQKKVLDWEKKEYLEEEKATTMHGVKVIPYTEQELEEIALEYCNSKDDYVLYYDEDVEEWILEW